MASVVAMLATLVPTASAAPPPAGKPTADKAIFFGSDGMRPDLMRAYAAEGAMPTYAELLAAGVAGENGLQQGFPPNTGVGWYTLATGTWPASTARPTHVQPDG
jgi:predicted AlkP superfamily pyrophosphatase or phosphodiesterase